MGAFQPIKVGDLAELKERLRVVHHRAESQMTSALNKSAKLVASTTRKYVVKQSGRAAGSIRATSTDKLARVTEGGGAAPYMGWRDFGGKRRLRGGIPYRRGGRYIYYTLGKHHDEIKDTLKFHLDELAKLAGLHWRSTIGK